jgi:hypothetical protein
MESPSSAAITGLLRDSKSDAIKTSLQNAPPRHFTPQVTNHCQ